MTCHLQTENKDEATMDSCWSTDVKEEIRKLEKLKGIVDEAESHEEK